MCPITCLAATQRLGAAEIGEQVGGVEIDDVSEASAQAARLELHLIEREVAEAREHFRLGLIGEAGARRLSVFTAMPISMTRAPCSGSPSALVEHQRNPRVGKDVQGRPRAARSLSGEPSAAVATLTNEQ